MKRYQILKRLKPKGAGEPDPWVFVAHGATFTEAEALDISEAGSNGQNIWQYKLVML